ncbi:MAG: rhodanese-like domain-containing protein [Desulfuromonadales bacterium]|nr:rhodanese-like domain-containing protein [Desulfuromonadales bacterium]
MKKTDLLCLTALFILLTATLVAGAEVRYHYLPPFEVEKRLKAGEQLFLLDIQVEEEFAAHHLQGALPTYAYPVQSEAEKAKLDAIVPLVKESTAPVLVICPRGGGGATRTVDHLVANGIEPRRVFILEKGQAGWKNKELVEGN